MVAPSLRQSSRPDLALAMMVRLYMYMQLNIYVTFRLVRFGADWRSRWRDRSKDERPSLRPKDPVRQFYWTQRFMGIMRRSVV
jgi:hypothetical protein